LQVLVVIAATGTLFASTAFAFTLHVKVSGIIGLIPPSPNVTVSPPALAVAAAVPALATTRYQHLTIRAAAQLCKQMRLGRQYRVAVTGYFRSGPENHGPDPINGALFDSDLAPQDAALHIRKYHGIPFGTKLRLRYSGSIDGISRPHARVSVCGVLFCSSFSPSFLKPEAISVSRA
jgi:hypothetical protein